MIVRELHIFDFDATLFDSPMHPDDWEGHIGMWYDTLQSLTPPCVIEPDALWIKSTVAAARRSLSTPDVYTVLMTGRSAEPQLAARVTELVQSAGLDFDEIHLKTGGKTVDWKSQMLSQFLRRLPGLEVVQIWDDRGHHLEQFVKLIEDAGLVAIPHFVDYVLHEPCVLEGALREYVHALLIEKEIRSQKDKRTLYHAGKRPAAPKPKMRWFERGQADEEWVRHWLESPVRSGVFLSPNPVDIAQFHGVSGNVYAYRVPEWVIEKSGGIHRFDQGSEVLIPSDVWEEAGSEIEFLGKSMDQQELLSKIDMSMRAYRGRKGNPQKPGWMSTEEWKETRDKWAKGSYVAGLRATKHLENAVKMMTPAERAEALEAFEQDKPRSKLTWPDWAKSQMDDWDRPRTEKDLEIMATLRKYLNEATLRTHVRAILTEQSSPEADKIARLVTGGRPDQAFELMLIMPEIDPEAVVLALAQEFQNQEDEMSAFIDEYNAGLPPAPRGSLPLAYSDPKFITLYEANDQFLEDVARFVYGRVVADTVQGDPQRLTTDEGVMLLAALEFERGIPLAVEDLTNRLQAARDE